MAVQQYYGTGRRKKSSARVNMRPGNGQITVNGKPLDEYFGRETARMVVRQPLELTDTTEKLDIKVSVFGGGSSGQAGAIRHAVARALTVFDPELRAELKPHGFLRRDPRMKERKKAGRPGARKRYQFSKR